MFNLINRTVDYSLHPLFGFDLDQVSLSHLCTQEPGLILISELYTTAAPVLAISKVDNGSKGAHTIDAIAQDVESLLYTHNYDFNVHPVKAHVIDEKLKNTISSNRLSVLNSKYVFLESPDTEVPIDIYDFVFSIQLKNLTPVINFPEKNPHFTKKDQRLLRLKDRGCVFHIDLLSLTGHFGKEAKRVANSLLQSNQVHFVSLQVKEMETIKKNKGIRISKNIANLLDEQLFVS